MKTAIVTGASRGIGASTAQKLAQKGYLVIINYNNSQKHAQEVCDKINSSGGMAECFKADVSRPKEVKAMTDYVVSTYGGIDLAVANAGIGKNAMLTDMTDEEISAIIDTNLKGLITFSRECAKSMLHRHNGNIITVASMWGQTGASCESVYSASKGGIIAFTKALAKELAPSNIQVNALACGVINTAMNAHLTPEESQELAEEIPAGRFGTPEEAAQLVLMLAEAPSYMTGQIIGIDGGFL